MITLVQANALNIPLPARSVQCVVTSPPYWGLRDYGTAQWIGGDLECDHVIGEIRTGLGMEALGERYRGGGHKAAETKTMMAKGQCPKCGAIRKDGQLGLERTPEEYVENMVDVFREVWRVLRDDGTVWLNLGDSYSGGGGACPSAPSSRSTLSGVRGLRGSTTMYKGRSPAHGLKAKDMVGIPWRVAFALQADGWYLRRDIIWSKPNPMPESVMDRPTTAHEYLFLLAKSGVAQVWIHRETGELTRSEPCPDYRYFNNETGDEVYDDPGPGWRTETFIDDYGEEAKLWTRKNMWRGMDYYYDSDAIRETCQSGPSDIKKMIEQKERIGGKNKELVDPFAKASSTTNIGHKRGVGDPSGRNRRSVWEVATVPYKGAHFATFPPSLVEPCILAGSAVGDLVIDPFSGSGTVGEVCLKHGRRFFGGELKREYIDLARERLYNKQIGYM